MTATIQQLYQSPALRKDVAEGLIELHNKFNDAVNDAIDAGIPLILVSAVVQAHAQLNTAMMLEVEDAE